MRRVRGGGETASKTGELTESGERAAESPANSGAEIIGGPGNTKTMATVVAVSAGWQHAMLQSIAAFRP